MNSALKTVGFWELGYNTPIVEADLWEFPMREMGVEEHTMIPVSGIRNNFIQEEHDIDAVLAKNSDLTVVYVVENGDTPLKDFKHPERALYITGRTTLNPKGSQRPQDLSVRVETALDNGMLWAHQALLIVLYDRRMKWL